MTDEIPATVRALLGYIYSAEGPHGRIILGHTAARRKAAKLGLVTGSRMKSGHRYAWRLTEAGRRVVEDGPKGP